MFQDLRVSPTSPAPQQQLHGLYRDHHGWLQAWLRKRLGDRERAADIAHDTFLRLLVSGRLPGHDEGRSYLVQLARNLVIDQWRRQRIEQAYLASIAHLDEPQTPSLETRAMILQTLQQIDQMLDSMPAKVRSAFLLSRFEGLGYAEIAERLGVTVSSVQKYMIRAIQACYQVLYSE
ncbi:sigma-70 family RNA polymerase sigma factor [Pseudomonas sp. SORT22]|nr:sigma-70 family RNA polymerase sigma factor [Pseudomonas sp. SORT22]